MGVENEDEKEAIRIKMYFQFPIVNLLANKNQRVEWEKRGNW